MLRIRTLAGALMITLVALPAGCKKCHVCDDIGGPCGVYSTAGRGYDDGYVGPEAYPQDIVPAPADTLPREPVIPRSSTEMAPRKTSTRTVRTYR